MDQGDKKDQWIVIIVAMLAVVLATANSVSNASKTEDQKRNFEKLAKMDSLKTASIGGHDSGIEALKVHEEDMNIQKGGVDDSLHAWGGKHENAMSKIDTIRSVNPILSRMDEETINEKNHAESSKLSREAKWVIRQLLLELETRGTKIELDRAEENGFTVWFKMVRGNESLVDDFAGKLSIQKIGNRLEVRHGSKG